MSPVLALTLTEILQRLKHILNVSVLCQRHTLSHGHPSTRRSEVRCPLDWTSISLLQIPRWLKPHARLCSKISLSKIFKLLIFVLLFNPTVENHISLVARHGPLPRPVPWQSAITGVSLIADMHFIGVGQGLAIVGTNIGLQVQWRQLTVYP